MMPQQTPAPTTDAEQEAGRVLAPDWLAPLLRRRGVSGTVHSGGQVYREWDRFTWLQWAQQADQMLRVRELIRAGASRFDSPRSVN